MEGFVAILMPVMIVFIVLFYRHKSKELELSSRAEPKRIGPSDAEEEKKQLEARIQNLESIVCSVDFELNQRLNRMAAEQSQIGRLAAPASPGSPGAPASPAGAVEPLIDTSPGYRLGQLSAGQVVLGRYTVLRELGRGGMGAVYLAQDAKLNERVALKTISSLTAGDPEEMVERFRLEVQAARKVTHPNVIRIHDLGEDGPLLFLSMEYVEGDTLWARVKRTGPPTVTEARALLADITAGMAAAHAAGVVHRDLKPQNVLVAKSAARVVKVIDFGLAKTSFATGMTATGLIMGTPEYMSPEQIRGQRSDARADVYALGAVAYYLLVGHPPFVADSPIAVGFAQVNDAPRPLRQIRAEIPERIEAVVLKALAKQPVDRYRDASELKAALENA